MLHKNFVKNKRCVEAFHAAPAGREALRLILYKK